MSKGGKAVYSEWVAGVLVFKAADDGTELMRIDPTEGLVPSIFTPKGVFRFGDDDALHFGLGALETPTIASGVLTVTKPFVNPLPESSTADQVDSIVYTGVAAGDILVIHVPATNTITFDDANINLGAATRAVAPGGTLVLLYDGTQWSEVVFLAASDNS